MDRAPKDLPRPFATLFVKAYRDVTAYLVGETKDTQAARAHVVAIALQLQDLATESDMGGAIGRYANLASIGDVRSALHFVQQINEAMLADVQSKRYRAESLP